ncbi:MAG: 3-deoxy-D-manno-octulosonic acid transferase [Acidobacteriaceae bacterium]
MNYLLYNLLLWMALVLGAPLWTVLLVLHPKWRAGLGERIGLVPRRLRVDRAGAPVVWIHAVSVGEVLAAAGLVRELEREHQVFVSTTTLTGQTLARARFGAQRVFYFPFDLRFAVRAYLGRLNPALVVLLETEFWPNFLREARRSAKVAVVNARISDRSLPGYNRRRTLVTTVLQHVDLFAAQSEQDARRLVQIGAPESRVEVGGNLKFDWQPPPEPALIESLRAAIAGEELFPVIVAGSTVEGEEPLLLRAFSRLGESFPKALLVLAPRHPERFAAAAQAIIAGGFTVQRRSQWQDGPLPLSPGVFLLDSIGELASVYQLADIAFIGGSLTPRGGHNILEPASFGKPITVGPHTENFREIVAGFQAKDAVVVAPAEEIGDVWIRLASDSAYRDSLGERARAVIEANTGATARTISALAELERRA